MDPKKNQTAHRGRHAARSRLRTLVTSTLVTGLAAVLGLSGASGTYAFLNATGSAPGATIRSGTLTLAINLEGSGALGTWTPSPSIPEARTFTVTNTGDAPATLSGLIEDRKPDAMAPYSTARVTPVTSGTACKAGLTGIQGPLVGYTTANLSTLAPGAKGTFCLEVGLLSNTPISLSGQEFDFTLTITGVQSAN